MTQPLCTVCILGRQPALGLAELESLYGPGALALVSPHVAGLSLEANQINFERLGGSTRVGNVLGTIDSNNWNVIEKTLIALVKSSAFAIPTSGKFHLGLSSFGFDVSPAKLNALGLTLKKILRARHTGSVRLVPNNEAQLSTAQVYHSHLADTQGAELLIIQTNSHKTILARTVAVQDIDRYRVRDRGRPRRDARVGMLPPKLAQIIINLASADANPVHGAVVLDPFCGTGVVLQEAIMMGFEVYGTDLEPRMVQYSDENLLWLLGQPGCPVRDDRTTQAPDWRYFKLEQADATTHHWQPVPSIVACETYLGRPFTERPSPAVLAQTIAEVNTIIKKFLTNIHPQLASGSRLCLALPAWHMRQGWTLTHTKNEHYAPGSNPDAFRHLPVLGALETLGYKRVGFTHTASEDLVYHREGQIVGRELVTLQRK